METLNEILASGSLVKVGAALKARTERFQFLSGEATKRGTAAEPISTQAEIDEMAVLDSEMIQLDTKFTELKSVEDAKVRNAVRIKAIGTPSNPITFPGAPSNGNPDNNDPARKSFNPAYTSIASLKHINMGGTRQENEELAFKFAQFFFATSLRAESPLRAKAIKYCEEHGIELKALNEGLNEQGAALVPPDFDPMLIKLIEQHGVFRNFTRVVPMVTDTKTQPRRTSGMQAFWVGESKQITASNPQYDNINLVAKKLAALAVMSSEIAEDSAINIADELAFEIAYAFALAEDLAGFFGDGTSPFGNITGITEKLKGLDATPGNIAGLVVGTGNNYSELLIGDFHKVIGRLPKFADSNAAAWYCHRTFFYTVMHPLEMAAAGGMTKEDVARGERRPRPLFLGYPVNFVQSFPRAEANSQIPVLLGDLAMGSTMGDRRIRTMFTNPYSLSDFDQISVRCTERIDINVHDVGNASATAESREPGPIVGLIMAAA